jgi:hypothetical protein
MIASIVNLVRNTKQPNKKAICKNFPIVIIIIIKFFEGSNITFVGYPLQKINGFNPPPEGSGNLFVYY